MVSVESESQSGSLIVNLTFWGFSMFLHKMFVFSKGACPTNPWTYFLGEKNACGKTAGGIVLVRMTFKLMEVFEFWELSIRVDFGTVKGHWGNFQDGK